MSLKEGRSMAAETCIAGPRWSVVAKLLQHQSLVVGHDQCGDSIWRGPNGETEIQLRDVPCTRGWAVACRFVLFGWADMLLPRPDRQPFQPHQRLCIAPPPETTGRQGQREGQLERVGAVLVANMSPYKMDQGFMRWTQQEGHWP